MSNTCSGEPGEGLDNEVNAHLGNPSQDGYSQSGVIRHRAENLISESLDMLNPKRVGRFLDLGPAHDLDGRPSSKGRPHREATSGRSGWTRGAICANLQIYYKFVLIDPIDPRRSQEPPPLRSS